MTPSSSSSARLAIQYVNQDFLPEVGAGPARLSEMGKRWRELGADVTIVAGIPTRRLPGRADGEMDPRYAGKWVVREEWDGLAALRSWVFTRGGRGFVGKVLDNLSFAASGYVAARRHAPRPDVVLASSPPFFPHITGVALKRAYRVPLVLEIRDLWPDYLVEMDMLRNATARRALFALERWLLARADHVVVVTESFKQRVVAKGVPAERITVIPNGVDLGRYRPEPVRCDAIPGLVLRDDERVVGYVGTFGRGQALAQVVRAAQRLETTHPDVRVVLIGDGPDRPNVEAAIAETGVRNVTMLAPIPRDLTVPFYNLCDVSLVPLAPIPIFQETIPSKIFEVLACARPLVASLAGEGARIVRASGAGDAVPAGDDAALATAIGTMLARSSEERAAMGARGRVWVAEHYDRRVLADRYFDLFTRLVASRASR